MNESTECLNSEKVWELQHANWKNIEEMQPQEK